MLTPVQSRRAFWLKHLYRWHWISSALCLVGMLLFTVTGFTLNHAGQIEASPDVRQLSGTLPPALMAELATGPEDGSRPLPAGVSRWLASELGIQRGPEPPEWSAEEIYLALPRPGGDAWLTIQRQDGAVAYEDTSRGWIAYLNDLHKGRHAGPAWSLFIDLFAFACLVFCLTGLFLLQLHAERRPSTWPLVGLGFVLPMLLAVLLVH